jgi:hypothetical protein
MKPIGYDTLICALRRRHMLVEIDVGRCYGGHIYQPIRQVHNDMPY